MITISVTEKELNNDNGNGGVEIHIPGTSANPTDVSKCPIFIEQYKGQIRVAIWNGSEKPQIIPLNFKRIIVCPHCNNDLTEKYSVIKMYPNKDPEKKAAHIRGQYNDAGEFKAYRETPIESHIYDLTDSYDICTCCGEIINP